MKRLMSSLLALATLACGSGSDSTSPPASSSGFSAAMSAAFAGQVSRALANGLGNVSANQAPAARVFGPPSGLPVFPTLVNVSVKQRTACTAGGYIEATGNLSGNISDQGSGALFLQVLETISDWRCVGSYVVNGDPYLSAAGTFTFLNGNINYPVTMSIGGAFKWGTGSAQSCSIQLSVLMNATQTGRVSGTVCGNSVNETF